MINIYKIFDINCIVYNYCMSNKFLSDGIFNNNFLEIQNIKKRIFFNHIMICYQVINIYFEEYLKIK